MWKGPEGQRVTGEYFTQTGLETKFACDSPCVLSGGILCDFCSDIFPPGVRRALQGAPGSAGEGGKPDRRGCVPLPGALQQGMRPGQMLGSRT